MTASLIPQWELLRGHDIRILSRIQACYQRRGPDIPAANIERPRGQSTPLIIIESDVVVDVAVEAASVCLM
jgi:hypothetical protein